MHWQKWENFVVFVISFISFSSIFWWKLGYNSEDRNRMAEEDINGHWPGRPSFISHFVPFISFIYTIIKHFFSFSSLKPRAHIDTSIRTHSHPIPIFSVESRKQKMMMTMMAMIMITLTYVMTYTISEQKRETELESKSKPK